MAVGSRGRVSGAFLLVAFNAALAWGQPVEYRVSIPQPEHHWAEVEVTFAGVPAGAFGVRIPFVYLMSRIPGATLFQIGLGTPASSFVQIVLCLLAYRHRNDAQVHFLVLAQTCLWPSSE